MKILFGLLICRPDQLEVQYGTGQCLLHIEKSLRVVPLDSDNVTSESKENISSIDFSDIEQVEANENQPIENNHSLRKNDNATSGNDTDKESEGKGKENVIEKAPSRRISKRSSRRRASVHGRRVSNFNYDHDTLGKLEEVVSAGKLLRFRLLMTTTVVGILMVAACVAMMILLDSGILSTAVFGRRSVYSSLMSLWGCFLFFGIMPGDLITARLVSLFILFGVSFYGLYCLWGGIDVYTVKRHEFVETIDDDSPLCGSNLPNAGCVVHTFDWFFVTMINAVWVNQLRHSFVRARVAGRKEKFYDSSRAKGYRFNHSYFKRSSREALDAIWSGGRMWFFLQGVRATFVGLILHAFGEAYAPTFSNDNLVDNLIYAFINCSIAIIYTPKRRQRIISFFTNLIVVDETKSAASVAALLGNVKASVSLALAKQKFRTICFSKLRSDDFSSNSENAESMNELFDDTERTVLGDGDVFLSHSWHDNGKKKFKALKSWCENFKTKHGRYPRLWLDKACIDQKDIASDLVCLPLFLAGCDTLLIIAGPTYTERLWCVMEVFVFLQMGGSIHRVTVIAIDAKDEQEAKSSFELADINKCKCHLESDRKKLLSIVQQGFGSFDTFNSVIRQVFKERMFEERITLEEKIEVLASQNHKLNEKVDEIIKDQAIMLANQAKFIERLTSEMAEMKQLIQK